MSGIVVGVDGSETALSAARRAASLANALGEPLHLVMAMKPGSSQTYRHGAEEFFDDGVDRARQSLRDIALEIGFAGATTAIGGRDPAKAICAEAERLEASLIVVGNRRVQGAVRLLGSVASDVLRHAPCDVLVAETMSATATAMQPDVDRHSIGKAKLFLDCTDEQRDRISQLAAAIQVPAGRNLTTQGQSGREFGVLLDGSATVSIDGRVVATLGAGDHFGEMSLLAAAGAPDRIRSATVTADTELWIGVMSIPEFEVLLAAVPEIGERLRRSSSERAAQNVVK